MADRIIDDDIEHYMAGTKYGPRPGSRPWLLINLKPGSSLLFEVKTAKVSLMMQQINADMYKNGLQGQFTQSHILGVEVNKREVVDIIRVTRKPL